MATRKKLAQHKPLLTAAGLLHDWRAGFSTPPPCCECNLGLAVALCAACLKTICRSGVCRHKHAGDTWSELPITLRQSPATSHQDDPTP